MAKRLTLTIDPSTGETKLEASGFTGQECLKETANLEEALGKVEKREMKAEAYQTTGQQKLTVGR